MDRLRFHDSTDSILMKIKITISVEERFQRLLAGRKKAIHGIKQDLLDIDTPFKAVNRSKFEQQFPGRIEREGLKCVMDMFDGTEQEVVLLPKNKQGEWDVTLKRRQGACVNTNHTRLTKF